ncbi:hypothetical protein [Nocardioides sp. Root151]|uniref:hypothetical protein n=1 Tax=Nocardioides sp. Root151 TaxID=1736475 RepID=UPI0007031642|nr:hypothetical protein [Nocardioides sp. Root151]KQZ67403.1 hypothetical protein ASD66_20885 [Nocardioides sp. Root151]
MSKKRRQGGPTQNQLRQEELRQKRLRQIEPGHRALRIAAGLVSLIVLAGCAHQLHVTQGAWGKFVPWAVFTIVAAIWPVAFLIAEFLSSAKQQRRLYVAVGLLVASTIGLVQVGWGMVALLDPAHVIGWHIPGRFGGREIDSLASAHETGRLLVGIGGVMSLVIPAICGGLFLVTVATEQSDATSPDDDFKPALEAAGLASIIAWFTAVVLWFVALVLGLIALIVPDSVTDRLAQCDTTVASCGGDAWAANHLPWVLTIASLLTFLVGGLLTWATPEFNIATELLAGLVLQAGSVVAVTSGVRWLQWQDTTCGPGASRRCGASDPDFSFTEGWLHQPVVLGASMYAVMAYVVVFPLLGTAQSIRARNSQRIVL